MTVLLRPSTPAPESGMWGLLAAVALADAIAPLIPKRVVSLKWPNDVLVDGAKLAGVLSEAAIDPIGRLAWIVIGIGANLLSAPSLPDRPTACVGPGAPAPEAFAENLLARLAEWRRMVLRDGFAEVRAAWLERGPALGLSLTVKRGDGEQAAGRFAGLNPRGELLLSLVDGVRALASGEIACGC